MSYRSPLANSCSPKSKFYFTKRTSSPLANNSSRRTIVHPIQNMLFGELKFTIGERCSRRTSSRRTLVRGGWFSSRERIFWRTVRQFAAEYGRTRANPGELRRTPANVRRTPANVRRSSAECRCWRTDGEFARSSREFARVRPSSRRTTVRRVYCPVSRQGLGMNCLFLLSTYMVSQMLNVKCIKFVVLREEKNLFVSYFGTSLSRVSFAVLSIAFCSVLLITIPFRRLFLLFCTFEPEKSGKFDWCLR